MMIAHNPTVHRIADDLRKLGVVPGSSLLVHSSLSALGHVEGGPETVIQGLLKALGAEGTLLIPALSYEFVTRRNPHFDIRKTPSNIGLIPEYFRKRYGTNRSMHPMHSVCAVGPKTDMFLNDHYKDTTPCGEQSPFHKLPEIGGYILMLGCGLKPNTSMHAIEECIEPRYLFGAPFVYELTDEQGVSTTKLYTPHNFNNWEQRYDRVAAYMKAPGLRQGTVLNAHCYLVNAQALWAAVLKEMRKNPLAFVARLDE